MSTARHGLLSSQATITYSKLIIETQEQGVKYVQSFAPCFSVSIVNFEQVNAGLGWRRFTSQLEPENPVDK